MINKIKVELQEDNNKKAVETSEAYNLACMHFESLQGSKYRRHTKNVLKKVYANCLNRNKTQLKLMRRHKTFPLTPNEHRR
jgi:hypothetical protein